MRGVQYGTAASIRSWTKRFLRPEVKGIKTFSAYMYIYDRNVAFHAAEYCIFIHLFDYNTDLNCSGNTIYGVMIKKNKYTIVPGLLFCVCSLYTVISQTSSLLYRFVGGMSHWRRCATNEIIPNTILFSIYLYGTQQDYNISGVHKL